MRRMEPGGALVRPTSLLTRSACTRACTVDFHGGLYFQYFHRVEELSNIHICSLIQAAQKQIRVAEIREHANCSLGRQSCRATVRSNSDKRNANATAYME